MYKSYCGLVYGGFDHTYSAQDQHKSYRHFGMRSRLIKSVR
ncbi:hypothetical protein [Anabaena sp. CS-542/02]|nr:hypothetical protein [Anabaena sp. CS-542/02]